MLDSVVDNGIYVSKSDLVTAAVRELIMTGGLEPGTPLRQRQVAVWFGVSATPVREALRRLESEGLITNDAHKGSIVARSAGDLHEKIQIRAVLEGLAAKLAAPKVTASHLTELRAYNDRLLTPQLSPPQLETVNRRFHFRIYEIAESPLLLSLMRLLWKSFPGGPQVFRNRKESYREHNELIEALDRHDGDEASRITQQHVLGVLDRVDAAIGRTVREATAVEQSLDALGRERHDARQ
jgi:DNA-binding GntR family transcriptional regulator